MTAVTTSTGSRRCCSDPAPPHAAIKSCASQLAQGRQNAYNMDGDDQQPYIAVIVDMRRLRADYDLPVLASSSLMIPPRERDGVSVIADAAGIMRSGISLRSRISGGPHAPRDAEVLHQVVLHRGLFPVSAAALL